MDYIKFKGEQWPFNIGMAAISEIEAFTNQNVFLGANVNTQFILASGLYGLKHGCRRDGKLFKETFESIADYTDEHPEFLVDVMKLFKKQVLSLKKDDSGEAQPLAVNQ